MKTLECLLSSILLTLIAIFAVGGGTTAAMAAQEGILVGRVAFIDGKLFRYVTEERDWVLTVRDAPFGLEDALYSGEETQAEIIMPNRTWVRIGESTQLQLISLKPDATTVDIASGLARLYNKNRDAVIKVNTPFGYLVAPGGTVFDLYVGDDSLEVIAIEGDVDFVHEGNNARYSLRAGVASIIADKWQITRGNGTVDRDWDDWNGERDKLWAQRLRARGSFSDLLPEPIREDAYVLEEHGRWERVYYEGAYRDMWRPLRVEHGWRPFTVGRWSVYYGDNCWIPSEPFGYITHHYGSWVYIDSFRAWYWSPPVIRVTATTPSFFIGFGWYPGRVGWFHSGPSVGWVPLAPHEPYYGHRPWGHRTVIVHKTTVATININQYRYLDEAVVIHRDHFYRGDRYTPFIEHDVNKTVIVNNYRPTTVINTTVINNYNIDRSRFTLTDERIDRKPHATVIKRITENQQKMEKADRLNRGTILQELTQTTAASEPPAAANIRGPMLTAKVVAADSAAKPLEKDAFRQRVIKPKERERRITDNDTLLLEVPGQQPATVQAPMDRNDRRGMQAAKEARKVLMSESQAVAGMTDPPPDGKQRGWRNPGTTDQVAGAVVETEKRVPRSPREERRERKEPAFDQPAARVMPSERMPARLDRTKEQVDAGTTDQVAGAVEETGKRVPRSPREERRERKEPAFDQPAARVMPSERMPARLDPIKEQVEHGGVDLGAVAEEQKQKIQQRGNEDLQRLQQVHEQQRQIQEAQRLQQVKGQQRQDQEVQRREQEKEQRRQEQEVQRLRQKQEQQLQDQEVQRREQEKDQRRQEQEVQRRQQKQEQESERRRQEKEVQQRQPREDQQQEAQQMKKKKKSPAQEEFEQQMLLQQQAPKQ